MTPELHKHLRQIRSTIEEQVKSDVLERKNPLETISKLFDSIGSDEVKWFFAETAKAADYDGRISQESKKWARNFCFMNLLDEDGSKYGQISDGCVHRAHIDQLIRAIIKTEKQETNT